MVLGTHLDLNSADDPADRHAGSQPILTRAHMIGLRALLVLYVPAFVLMFAMNYRPVGNVVFRLSSQHFWFALAFGILVVTAVATFFLLLGIGLYHYRRGHAGPRPASWWLWVMVLLNVAGVVAYYLRVIEPEQQKLGDIEHST